MIHVSFPEKQALAYKLKVETAIVRSTTANAVNKNSWIFKNWDKVKQTISYLNTETDERRTLSIANMYFTDYDMLRNLGKYTDAGDPITVENILRIGAAFLIPSVNSPVNNFNEYNFSSEVSAYKNRKGLWREGFLKEHASSRTIEAANNSIIYADKRLKSFFDKDIFSQFAGTDHDTIMAEVNALKVEIRKLREALEAQKASSNSNRFERIQPNYFSILSLALSALSVYVGLKSLKRSSEDSENQQKNADSLKLSQMNMQMSILELEYKMKILESKIKEYNVNERLNPVSPYQKGSFASVNLSAQ